MYFLHNYGSRHQTCNILARMIDALWLRWHYWNASLEDHENWSHKTCVGMIIVQFACRIIYSVLERTGKARFLSVAYSAVYIVLVTASAWLNNGGDSKPILSQYSAISQVSIHTHTGSQKWKLLDHERPCCRVQQHTIAFIVSPIRKLHGPLVW